MQDAAPSDGGKKKLHLELIVLPSSQFCNEVKSFYHLEVTTVQSCSRKIALMKTKYALPQAICSKNFEILR